MQEAVNREQVRTAVGRFRRDGLRTALVPTMGNLHRGHLALVEAARHEADRVVASIYVNPTQFGEGEEFENYPRTLDADRQALERSGCDLLFVPDQHSMYPLGAEQSVCLRASPDLSEMLEGEFRPGHFDGVVTVVARLFNLVCPDVAVFGEKDYQQLLVIRRMVHDLGYDIGIVAVPTVREASGLAMSSRNNYLEAGQKDAAAELNAVLMKAADRVVNGPAEPGLAEREAARDLQRLGMRVDYVAVRRAEDLQPPGAADRDLRVLAAAWCGQTRLIDNVKVGRVGI